MQRAAAKGTRSKSRSTRVEKEEMLRETGSEKE
jgi:hypothetical protein